MQITKCDICKKQIKRGETLVHIAVREKSFDSFEICAKCGKAAIKMLRDKKLIENKKDGK
jgi:hypothetical protein